MQRQDVPPGDQAERMVDDIANRLRIVRRGVNMGQAEVAEATGASLSTYKGLRRRPACTYSHVSCPFRTFARCRPRLALGR